MKRLALIALVSLTLAGCAAQEVWAPDDAVRDAAYTHPGPSTITVYTVVNNGSGSGAHSGLMISGSQRVLFDPAGSFSVNVVPERNDVHYGMSDPVMDFYIDYHTRVTYHTIIQTVEVSPEIARRAKMLAQAHGAVPKAQCAISVGRILDGVPGFEDAPNGYSPKALTRYFDSRPGVTRREYRDFDSDDNSGVIAAPPVLIAAN